MLVRHVISLVLLIVAPLVLISWFGTYAVRRQWQQRDDQLRSIVMERLTEIDRDLNAVSAKYQSTLTAELQTADRDPELLRGIRQRVPCVRSSMLVDRDGGLVYPVRPDIDNPASIIWYSALTELARTRPIGDETESSSSRSTLPVTTLPVTRLRWQTWYHEGGLQLVLWMPRSDRTATGVVLERGRWIADLIAALPSQNDVSGRYVLRDSDGRIVYRWGRDVGDVLPSAPLASARLSPPWSAWEMSYFGKREMTVGWWSGGLAPLVASLLAVAVSLLAIGVYVLTSLRRQMNLAAQRVSFASQVSHELRTPLTNIRLYAELAKKDLRETSDPTTAAKAGRRLEIIEEECSRLSRIVSGVLAMVSRSGGGNLKTSRQAPDDVVRAVLDSFSPALERLEIVVTTDFGAGEPIALDEGVIDLALVNLLSNVEKYAQAGKHVKIISRQSGLVVTIDVIDEGPGIRRSDSKRIFDPFVRLDDSLSAPSGTGLGLAIARTAARRHGGDLVLVPSSRGAHFRFTFRDADQLKLAKSKRRSPS